MILLSERLQQLRLEAGLSREAIGAQGFISTPGWIKLENGQRAPSEELIGQWVEFLARNKYIPEKKAGALRDELLTLKYLGSRQPFVRKLARLFARSAPWGQALLAQASPPRPKRGRPAATRR